MGLKSRTACLPWSPLTRGGLIGGAADHEPKVMVLVRERVSVPFAAWSSAAMPPQHERLQHHCRTETVTLSRTFPGGRRGSRTVCPLAMPGRASTIGAGLPHPDSRLEAPDASVSAYRTPGSYRVAPGKRRRAKCICFCVLTHPAYGEQRARCPLKAKRIRFCVPSRVASSSKLRPGLGPGRECIRFCVRAKYQARLGLVGAGRAFLPFSPCS